MDFRELGVKAGRPTFVREIVASPDDDGIIGPGSSVRVVGLVCEHDASADACTIRDAAGGLRRRERGSTPILTVLTRLLTQFSVPSDGMVQFIGELVEGKGDRRQLQLLARVHTSAEGLDALLYERAVLEQRKFVSGLLGGNEN